MLLEVTSCQREVSVDVLVAVATAEEAQLGGLDLPLGRPHCQCPEQAVILCLLCAVVCLYVYSAISKLPLFGQPGQSVTDDLRGSARGRTDPMG